MQAVKIFPKLSIVEAESGFGHGVLKMQLSAYF